MARTVKTVVRQKGVYPWEEWLNGEVWELTPGEDIPSGRSFRASVYRACADRGLRVTTNERDGLLYIQASPK